MTTHTPTHRPDPELDTFETALLGELRQVVAENAVAAQAAAPARARRPRRAWAAGLGGLATVTAGALGITMLTATPAWSVDVDGRTGEITVKVNRLEGASALEKALAEHGVNAEVTYLAPGLACRGGRFTDDTPSGAGLVVGSESFEVTLPAGAVGAGETFVLSASVTELPGETLPDGTEIVEGFQASVDFGVAAGPVAPCVAVPSA